MRYNKAMAEQQIISPEEEIKKLERQLEEKKRAFAETGIAAPEEKEVFREVLKEHIESLRPAPVATPAAPVLQDVRAAIRSVPKEAAAHAKEQEANAAVVRALVEKAMTGTIEDAVKEAQKISPYILDELHDYLVNDAYDKLVALRKIKAL